MTDQTADIPEWGEKLSGFNSAIWRTSTSSPKMRSAMTALFLLDRAPDRAEMLSRMDRLTRQYPALRQRVVEPMGPLGQPRLVVDPHFDLDFHVALYRLPDPGGWDVLMRDVRRQIMADLDRDRPLWRAAVIEGLPGGQAALTMSMHHAIADGQGMVMMGAGLLDLTRESSVSDEPMPEPPAPGRVDRGTITAAALGSAGRRAGTTGLKALGMIPGVTRSLLSDPVGSAAEAAEMAASVSRLAQFHPAPLSPLLQARGATYTPRTLDIPFPALRAAARAHGGSLNDVFLAAVTGGMRRYHEEAGVQVGRLRVNVPISFRSGGAGAVGNSVTTARIELNAGESDVGTRVAEAGAVVAAAKAEPFLPHIDALADAFRLAPVEVSVMLTQSSDVTASNVPGIPVPLYAGGAEVLRAYPLVPTLGAAVNITMLTYAGQWCSLGITTDDAAIPDPDAFVRCLGEGFAEVGAEPGEHASDPLLAD
jgi:WS/DGAT/MGAT family acyltransferase